MSLPSEYCERKNTQENSRNQNIQEPINDMGEQVIEPSALVRHSVDLSTCRKYFQNDARSDIPSQSNRTNRWSMYSGDYRSMYHGTPRNRLYLYIRSRRGPGHRDYASR